MSQKQFNRALDEMEKKIEAACLAAGHKKIHVIYSAYESDEDDVPIDNLDEIAVKGTIVLSAKKDNYWGDKKSKDYCSLPVIDPTWLQITVLANAMISCVRDGHHVFLEGIKEVKAGVYRFCMGS